MVEPIQLAEAVPRDGVPTSLVGPLAFDGLEDQFGVEQLLLRTLDNVG
nr:hypothetical protein [Variovorax boronicumulans]